MSLGDHTITAGGVTKTLAEWGITSCVVTHRLGGDDGMVLSASRNVDREAIFASGAVLQLKDPAGIKRFVGRLMRPRRSAGNRSELHTYTVVGPLKYLQEVTYQQEAKFANDPNSVLVSVSGQKTARVILHRNPATTEKWSIRDQVQDALQYAIEDGAPISFSVSGVPETEPPEDQALDQRVSDVLRRTLGWAPHIGWRWDYGGLSPKFEAGDTVDGNQFATRTLELTDSIDWIGDERYDLLCPEFEICYIGENVAQAGDVQIKWLTIHRDLSTADNGAFGRQVSTVVLRGLVWDGEQWTDAEPRPADGLAASLHKAFKQLFYELEWSVQGESVDWTPQPGERWNIAGVTSGYASAQSVAQEIVRDIAAGKTSIKAGPPSNLGLADRLALLVPNRVRGLSHAAGESTYGMKPPETEEAPGYTEMTFRGVKDDGSGNATPTKFMVMAKEVE